MKTALLYRALFILFIVPALSHGNNKHLKDKHSKEKVIKKEFSVNADATLRINNSYGNLNIITWAKNTVEIEVTITTNSNNEEKAQKKLDEITVDFEASPNLVSAKTRFGNKKSNSWWNWGKNNKVNMKVNYVVKMPITNHVDLNNDYGNINLDRLEGRAKINCDYGKITTKELMADNNSLSFDYTNHCNFEYIKSGKINADYSEFTVGKSKILEINADYTKSKIEIAEDVAYNCDYGSLTVNNVNNLTGNGDYLTLHVGDVYKNVSLKSDYGSIKINRLMENAGDVTIKSDYTGVKIGYDPNHSFSFNINLGYASFKSDGLEITKEKVESSKKDYSGFYGTANSNSSIEISSGYGSVTLFKN